LFRQRSRVYEEIDFSAKGYVVPFFLLVFSAALAAGKIPVRFPEKTASKAAIDFLKANPLRGNMFNNDEIGDYVIYWLYPRHKVFIDGRSDMYGPPILKEYSKVAYIEPGWKDVLDKYDIEYIFFYTDTVLVRHLSTDAGWRQIYADNVASIFLRNTSENAETIARYASGRTVPGKGP
jgi:hypothetical protein